MTNIFDVASYILHRYGSMTTMKLQKLVFYTQSEYMRRFKRPLFAEDFYAWRNGPVSPDLFDKHRSLFLIRENALDAFSHNRLSKDEQETTDAVCGSLKELSGSELSERTHCEAPWKRARKGLRPEDPGMCLISKQSMLDYDSNHSIIN